MQKKTNNCQSLICYDLAKYNWPIPEAVKKYAKLWFKRGNIYSNSRNVGWMRKFGKTFVYRTFNLHRSKKGGLEVTEIRRQQANERAVLCNCDFAGYLAGWRVNYGNKWNESDSYESWTQSKNGGPFWGNCLNIDEMIRKYFPYCQYYSCQINISFWEFIQIYLREPKIELIIKAGYSKLVPSYRLLNRNGKTLAAILKVDDKWVEYLKNNDVWHLLACRKKGVKTFEDADNVADVLSNTEAKKFLKYAPGDETRMCNYLHSSNCRGLFGLTLYSDYLRFAETLGVPLNENKYLYPDNLRQAHDEAFQKIEITKSQERSAKMRVIHESLLQYQWSNGVLFIRPAIDDGDLINESKQMNNCVRTYADRYANGETAIFFIRKEDSPDKSLATLELKNKRVIQCLAKGNLKVDDNVAAFVSNWKAQFKFA